MARPRRPGALLGLAFAALAASPAPAGASPQDVFGFGPRAAALGATGAASAEGYECVHANPALLSTETKRRLDLGLMGAVFDLHAGGPAPYEALKGSYVGATLPIPLGGVLRDRLVLGLGFFTPFDLIVRGRILYPERVQFPVADRTQSVAIQVAAGVYLGHGLRVGGGFSALAALTGSVIVATDATGRIGTTVEDTLVASYAPVLGASLDLEEHYRLGLTYRGALEGTFNVVIDVEDLGQIVVPPLNISGTAQYDPHQVALEIARVTGPWRAAFGVTYKHWSAYPGLVFATVRCDLETAAGSGCQGLVPPDPDYSDTVVPHLGLERWLELGDDARLALRAGYALEPTPAPEQTGVGNAFDESRSLLGLGYGIVLPPVRMDAFAQLHVLHGRTHDKSDGSASFETSGTIFAGGTTLGVSF